MTTPRLGAPELPTGQNASPETMNEALRWVEQGASLFIVKDKDLATPPGSPTVGDCYIVAGSPTGAWTGWATRLAFRLSTSWEDITPIEGTFAYVQDENLLYMFDGAAWAEYEPSISLALDDLTDVDAASPSDGDTIVWVDAEGEWQAAPLPGGGGGGGTVPDGGSTGQVLAKASGVDQDTEWQTASVKWNLAGTGQTATGVYDFAVDGAKANIDFTGLGSFNELLVIARGLTAVGSHVRILQVSVDNGSSFYSSAGNYKTISVLGVEANVGSFAFHGTSSTAARSLVVHILNMKGAAKWCRCNAAEADRVFDASASDINAIRVANGDGSNINGGTIRVYAR